jgi:hypothetical protein
MQNNPVPRLRLIPRLVKRIAGLNRDVLRGRHGGRDAQATHEQAEPENGKK